MTKQIIIIIILILVSHQRASFSEENTKVTLDYKSKVDSCPKAKYIEDRVSDSLGYTPWSEWHPLIRVRIKNEEKGLIGTIEFPNGEAKILREEDCLRLTDEIVASVLLSLSSPSTQHRNVQLPPRQPLPPMTTINVIADSRDTEVKTIESESDISASNGVQGNAIYFKARCVAPCSFDIEPGFTKIAAGMARTSITLKDGHDYHLKIKTGSRTRVLWGSTISVTGALFALTGLTYALAPDSFGDGRSPWKWVGYGTAAMVGGGLLRYSGMGRVDHTETPKSKGELSLAYRGTF